MDKKCFITSKKKSLRVSETNVIWIDEVLNVKNRAEPIFLAVVEVKLNEKLVERPITEIPLQ